MENLEKLENLIKSGGFEYHITDLDKNQVAMIIQSKDPWDGVEFAELLARVESDKYPTGYIVKINRIAQKWNDGNNHVFFFIDGDEDYSHINNFKPSTESAYVEQLKKEAFERFEEIKEGDRFDLSNIHPNYNNDIVINGNEYDYHKSKDALFIGNENVKCCIYKQGKWATKIESFKATYIDWDYNDCGMEVRLAFKIPNWDKAKDKDKIGEYIAEQLEKYLNDGRTT